MKSIYELEMDLQKLLADELPYAKFMAAMKIVKYIISWKETELEDKGENKDE